jgi:adenine-specific DNA-methyltransferase
MICQSKWTHYNLEAKEIELLNKINAKLPRVSDYIESKPGIVTAANDYFILSALDVKKYKLENFVLPIIQKGMFVSDSIIFSNKDFETLVKEEKPAYLLALTGNEIIHKELQCLLDIGTDSNIHTRYKCSKRNNWYVIPNIFTPTEGWVFKRSHLYPKLLINSAKIRTTDAAYNISTKEGSSIESFIYSFYNTITLIFAELMGRKYGGGVLELTPSEFKNLPIPYRDIDSDLFKDFNLSFNKNSYMNTLITNDFKLLGSLKFLNNSELSLLPIIYNKLVSNRLN